MQKNAREQMLFVPAPDGSRMAVRFIRPDGPGPYPLAVLNHGAAFNQNYRAATDPRFVLFSSWFLSRGYAVAMPIRRGYGVTGGLWRDGYGKCEAPDFRAAGLRSAVDIQAAADALHQRSDIAPGRTVVVGFSAGGWAALALSSRNPSGIAAIVNVGGGRGAHKMTANGAELCKPETLVGAAGKYGASARMRTLWLYAENDGYFGPVLARKMVDAYTAAGGKAEFHMLNPRSKDGNDLTNNKEAQAVWSPILEAFLNPGKE